MSVRFAPSPTGLFHIGNLRTAWISHHWASTLKLPWVVRFENIDEPRNVAGAIEKQLADMKTLGLTPDQIVIQNQNKDRHWNVFLKFKKSGLIYPCFCSRKQIRQSLAQAASAPHEQGLKYNGHCRDLKTYPKTDLATIAWRMKTENPADDFIMARTRTQTPDPQSFVPAYHWACAIDDVDGKHTLLVRAWDLEHVTPLQRIIQTNLCHLENRPFEPAAIFHCALVTQNDGHRLEKRTLGVTLDELLARGENPESIIEKFSASCSIQTEKFKTGLVFGEPQKTITLGELKF